MISLYTWTIYVTKISRVRNNDRRRLRVLGAIAQIFHGNSSHTAPERKKNGEEKGEEKASRESSASGMNSAECYLAAVHTREGSFNTQVEWAAEGGGLAGYG